MIATWAGLRPLIAAPPNVDESEISREHEVFTRNDGLVIIAGGKLTTYRRMAREAVDETLKLMAELGETVEVTRATTKTRPLPGAEGLAQPDLEGVAAVGRRADGRATASTSTPRRICAASTARARR